MKEKLLLAYKKDNQFKEIIDEIIEKSDIDYISVEEFIDAADNEDIEILKENLKILEGNLSEYL